MVCKLAMKALPKERHRKGSDRGPFESALLEEVSNHQGNQCCEGTTRIGICTSGAAIFKVITAQTHLLFCKRTVLAFTKK